MKSVEIVVCLMLGAIFLISSVPKLRHPKGFVLTVLEYRILPLSISRLYGWVLPPMELLLALFLFTGTLIYLTAILTALLLLSFMVAIGINLVRGRDLDCHCFGTKLQRKIGWSLVLQDGLLLGAMAFVAVLASTHPLLEHWSIFSIIAPGTHTIFLAFLLNVGLTGSGVFVLRFSQSRRGWFPRARYLNK